MPISGDWMNLRKLELFVALAESAIFSRGAETVSLTQSTSSQHIAARLGSNEAVLQAVVKDAGCVFVSELSVGRDVEFGKLYKVEVKGVKCRTANLVGKVACQNSLASARVFIESRQ